jgi:hypothetical protein
MDKPSGRGQERTLTQDKDVLSAKDWRNYIYNYGQ